jgi:hypothetical protein
MKVSTNDGMATGHYGWKCSVKLNGQYVDNCSEADDEEGYVKVLEKQEGTNEMLKVTKRGFVEIVHPEIVTKFVVRDPEKFRNSVRPMDFE